MSNKGNTVFDRIYKTNSKNDLQGITMTKMVKMEVTGAQSCKKQTASSYKGYQEERQKSTLGSLFL